MSFRTIGSSTVAATAVFIVAGATAGIPADARQTAARGPSLTRTASVAVARSAPPLDPWERRSRLVLMNAGALPNRAGADSLPGTSSQLSIDLFDGASVTALFERFDQNETGVTWIGSVAGQPGSQVTVVQGGGLMAASIILPGASYTIRPVPIDPADPVTTSEAVHVLSQINSEGFKREAEPLIPAMTTEALEVAADAVMADTAEFIDVLVVYTARAENWAGGPVGILNWINLGMSETNTAYATSGVIQRVRLAHAERVAYSEVGNFSTNLNNLRNGGAGLGDVAARRNAYTADLVTMFVRPAEPASACGIAFIMTNVSTAFAPSGYSVVDSPCSSPNGTLAHEFGHNMGLRHDWYMDNGVTPFTYAHGHVNLIARFRTIMAYPDACASQLISCQRLLSFSNPDLTFGGQPMGVPGGTSTACPTSNAQNMNCDADERRALNNSAFAVANFREFSTDRPPTIRTHPQNQSIPRGQPLTLQVNVEGLGPLSFQWYRGAAPSVGQPIPGATGSSHTFVPGADGIWFERWFYWVRVTNAIGSVNSLTATISMLPPVADAGAPPQRLSRSTPGIARQSNGLGSPAAPRVRQATPPSSIAAVPVVPAHTPAGIATGRGAAGDDADFTQCTDIDLEELLAWAMTQHPANGSTLTRFVTTFTRVLLEKQLACREARSAAR